MVLQRTEMHLVALVSMLFGRPRLSEKPYCSARSYGDSDRVLIALQFCRCRSVRVSEATEISNKWWKGAVSPYFSWSNWERKLVDSIDIFAKVTGLSREFEMQRFGERTRYKTPVSAEITSKYWTYRKPANSTFCTKTYHSVKHDFLKFHKRSK